jgi:hypothetical protein
MRTLALGAVALLCACSGPPAPDAALCEDVIHRLCAARTCPGVNDQLALQLDCRANLAERSGCAAEEFAFTTPSRERVLACRQPLVRRGTSPEVAPTCDEVSTFLRDCPDVVQFLKGPQP